MKNLIFGILVLVTNTLLFSQTIDTLWLPDPVTSGGKPLMEALNERHSSRNFVDKPLSKNQLSNLLWAAYGVNRPGEGKRTAPSARNKQEIDLYVFMFEGVFLYDGIKHVLIKITSEDARSKTGSQDYVKDAAINIVYVLNKNKSGSSDPSGILSAGAISAGAIVQNVYLYGSSENFGVVVRGSYDKNLLTKYLKLTSNQEIIITQSLGYTE